MMLCGCDPAASLACRASGEGGRASKGVRRARAGVEVAQLLAVSCEERRVAARDLLEDGIAATMMRWEGALSCSGAQGKGRDSRGGLSINSRSGHNTGRQSASSLAWHRELVVAVTTTTTK